MNMQIIQEKLIYCRIKNVWTYLFAYSQKLHNNKEEEHAHNLQWLTDKPNIMLL